MELLGCWLPQAWGTTSPPYLAANPSTGAHNSLRWRQIYVQAVSHLMTITGQLQTSVCFSASILGGPKAVVAACLPVMTASP